MEICIGVFAHNEESNISSFVANIARQSLLECPHVNVTVHILANGCSDGTEKKAEESIGALAPMSRSVFHLDRIREGGKSRTWNLFVHHLAPKSTDYFVFMDADIFLPENDTLERMYEQISRSDLYVFNSRPVKDLTFQRRRFTLTEKIILKSSGGLDSYKTAICGQLYIARAQAMREIYLPIGLPVEDGFIRAMMLTDLLTRSEALERISGADDVFHVYESISTIHELFRHQTRIIMGSAINEVIFSELLEIKADANARKAALVEASKNERWLRDILQTKLPKWPYGFISFHYLIKRLSNYAKSEKKNISSLGLAAIGFSFDLLVYLIASLKMWRGEGAGYW